MLDSGKIHTLTADGKPLSVKKKKRMRNATVEDFLKTKFDEETEGTIPLRPNLIKRTDPVNKLARTLRRYKQKKVRAEDDLVKIMEKVKLDKAILLKEKIESIWSNTDRSDFKEVKHEIDKAKQRR